MNVKRLWGGVNNIQGILDASNLISADSVVKSVQRGKFSPGVQIGNDSIQLNSIDVNKSILMYDSEYYDDITVQLVDGNPPRISITKPAGSPATLTWQVIEFY